MKPNDAIFQGSDQPAQPVKRQRVDLFSQAEVEDAVNVLMNSDMWIKAQEQVHNTMPKLVQKICSKLSHLNGGSLGWQACLTGIKANLSWCIGHGHIRIHDNYNKPITGFYVVSAKVSSGKSLAHQMHRDDIEWVAKQLTNLRRSFEEMPDPDGHIQTDEVENQEQEDDEDDVDDDTQNDAAEEHDESGDDSGDVIESDGIFGEVIQ